MRDTPDWTQVLQRCRKCGKTKPVDPGFGVYWGNGNFQPRMPCEACRTQELFFERLWRLRILKRKP